MAGYLLNATAIIALLPALLVALRQPPQRDLVYWAVLAVAIVGTGAWVYVRQSAGWHTGLSTALWLTIVTCLILFSVLAAISPQGWRMAPLLLPYLLLLAVLATLWGRAPSQPLSGDAPLAWIGTHIVVSVATYGFVTLAAVAALAATIQERALKKRQATAMSRRLPSVADSEALVMRLLVAGEAILAAGLATGMATLYADTGQILSLDHKTILTLSVFAIIAVLLFLHYKTGVRGRSATRLVLLAYLLLTLGYPGVKLVTDILLV